ncbi:hypothetical protein [Streptomyces sp. NBC_01235]|uniref:hypothetical protein n=1 Tax=Streptomyces sp. NBC_01235 TaxID=2903788 RepID=UPI002E161A96|nr:hypothetical protein OG289_48820 [Streptomyces sp. NBC_01235]
MNYLWDETVLELRKRVVNFDLQYFYEVAEKNDNKRKELKDEEDLPKLDDQKLLTGCREIGVISDIGFQELDLSTTDPRTHPSRASPCGRREPGARQLTRWPKSFFFARTASPRVIDGRGTLNAGTWREAGWTARALGRPLGHFRRHAPLLAKQLVRGLRQLDSRE